MSRRWLWSLGLLMLLPPAWAAEEPKPPKEQVQAIVQELQTAVKELNERLQAAGDDEKEKIREELAALHTQYADRLAELAAKNLRNEASFEALKIATGNLLNLSKSEKPFDVLAKEFLQDERIIQVVQGLTQSKNPAAVKFVRTVAEKSRDYETKGKANYLLAILLQNRIENSGAPADELAKMIDETKKLHQHVIDNYADVAWAEGRLADASKAQLKTFGKIMVGLVHPEIKAEDTDGKEFKLSDYRGKVILLDFWGHW